MKCYYCETEFSGNVCPKCMAVYTISLEEAEANTSEEEIKATVKEDREQDNQKKKEKGKKGEAILHVVEVIGEIVEAIFD